MSDRANEFQDPGSNYPDRRDGTAEPGSASSADVTTGSAPDPAAAALSESGGTAQTTLAQNRTSEDERLDGIVEQTRADLRGESAKKVEHLLRARLRDAGIELDDSTVAELVDRIAAG